MNINRKNSLVAFALIGSFVVGSVIGPTVARAQGTPSATKFPPSKFACVTTVTSTNIAIESCRNAQMACAIAYDNTPNARPVQLQCK
ncbi:hypothetical protein E7T09_09300 [Deinococcus sp. KSM4-11]|uniref:hypothetical protein n=1 Tax=Deinococcus sp. KSM4-11 TaxID=2568654 RepID=UPI0010A56B74|nr:hypothetical protein [Deinococcus sp. KSM4-11]THF87322.1 hypothetical protein E7T09_09300 [Deinococcus sp. KSM4-11]